MQRFIAAVLTVLTICFAVYGFKAREAASNQRNLTEQQVIYLCSVARALDPIIVTVRNSLAVGAQRQQFTTLHLVLSQTEPCGEVEG